MMFNRKLKERIKELEADLKCEKAQHEHTKEKYNRLLNIKEDKTFGIFEDYLELRGLELEEGTLCYVEKYKSSYSAHYSTFNYIIYYTAIYKLINGIFVICECLEGDLHLKLESNGVKSYIQLFKDVEEKNKSDRLNEIIKKCKGSDII